MPGRVDGIHVQRACDDLAMTASANEGGKFWIAGKPEHQVGGTFNAEPDAELRVALSGNLTPDPRLTIRHDPQGQFTECAVSGSVESWVESFRPTTLHGQLDSSMLVTLLDAHNYGSPSGPADYRASAAIFGAHVNDDQLYRAVRFRMDRSDWLKHLTDGESSVVEDDKSALSVQASDDGNWLVYQSFEPATLRQLEIRVVSGCLALLQLALYPDKDRTIGETEVQIERGGPWLPVLGQGLCSDRGEVENKPLLTPESLGIGSYAKWIALHSKLDGLTWVVARPFMGAVQTQVLLLTTLVEGFHRALDGYEKSKFPGIKKQVLTRIRNAAEKAAKEAAATEGLPESTAEKATLTLHTEVSFQERARAIVDEVCASAAPEIKESVGDLPKRIKTARNDLAHQDQKGASKPLDQRVLSWLVVSDSLAWVLRCLLLLRAGIAPDLLHERLLASQRFEFYLANTAQHLEDIKNWGLPH